MKLEEHFSREGDEEEDTWEDEGKREEAVSLLSVATWTASPMWGGLISLGFFGFRWNSPCGASRCWTFPGNPKAETGEWSVGHV